MGDYIDNKVKDYRYNQMPNKGLAYLLGVVLSVTGVGCGGGGGSSATPPPTNPPVIDLVQDQQDAITYLTQYFNGTHGMSIDLGTKVTRWLSDATPPPMAPIQYEFKNLVPIYFDENNNALLDTYLLVGPIEAATEEERQKKIDVINLHNSLIGGTKILYFDPVVWTAQQEQDANEFFDIADLVITTFQGTTNPGTVIIHNLGLHRN